MKHQIANVIRELSAEWRNILNYWMEFGQDQTHGGFVGRRDFYNQLVPGAEKGAVLNTRILWTFSAAYRHFGDTAYMAIADRAFEYIASHFVDTDFGGLFWALDEQGNSTNTRKQIYAQGFGIYGLSEYFRATGNIVALNLAKQLFELIEQHSYDDIYGGYLEALDRQWQSLVDMRLSEKDENYPKSMNTHLHILEPYTNLYRVWQDEKLAEKIKKLIRVFLDHIIDHESAHFHLFFEKDWSVMSHIVSYGHDIEGAWLLTEAAQVLGDAALLEEVKAMALKMSEATLREGFDPVGGLNYERNLSSGELDTDKHWWPQAEALVGFVNAWELGGDQKYLSKSMEIWQFIQEKIIDRQGGEWHWRVDENGKPNSLDDKAGFWKCPYHNSRACLELIERLRKVPGLPAEL